MKNQSASILLMVSLFWLVVSGCSPSDSGSSSSGTTLTGPIADLQGKWITSCYFDGDNYAKESFEVSGTDIMTYSTYYSDSDSSCSSALFKMDTNNSGASVGEKVVFADSTEGYRISYRAQKLTYTPVSSEYASLINAVSLCGLNNWEVDTTTDVLGMNCSGTTMPQKNATFYNVYNLIGTNLYLGTSKTDVYPTTVNTNVMYVKQ
jgi:hypothetical protein